MTTTSPTGWAESSSGLTRLFEFANFVEAFGFVTRVALVAQRLDHHPDITISWNKVTITTLSHDAGNTITDRDHKLAAMIEALSEP